MHPDKLPVINEKGMLLNYGGPHEDFVWEIRSEPGVIGAFESVYATEDLLVSFDAINYGFANRTHLPANKPWPHQDQDPEKPGFRCLQGLVNLHPNGPNDGGLIVCKGGHLLSEQFHRDMKDEERIPAWTPEWYGYTDAGMAWLKDHGLEWVKVEAEPGDLLLCKYWINRVAHLVKDGANTPRGLPHASLQRARDGHHRPAGRVHVLHARVARDAGGPRAQEARVGEQARHDALAQRAPHGHQPGQAQRAARRHCQAEAAQRAQAEREGVQADGCAVYQGVGTSRKR